MKDKAVLFMPQPTQQRASRLVAASAPGMGDGLRAQQYEVLEAFVAGVGAAMAEYGYVNCCGKF